MALTNDTTGYTVSLTLRCEMNNLLRVSLNCPPALYPQVMQGEFDYYLTVEVNDSTIPTLNNFQFHHIETTVNGVSTDTPTLVVDGWFDSPTAPQVDYDMTIDLF